MIMNMSIRIDMNMEILDLRSFCNVIRPEAVMCYDWSQGRSVISLDKYFGPEVIYGLLVGYDAKSIGVGLGRDNILQTSKMKLKDAVESLQVSKSTLMRACREYGIDRWPRRNINKFGCSQTNEWAPCVDLEQSSQLNLDDLPSTQLSASIVHTEPHDTMMQDANVVTIKAKYAEGNAIKFRLSLSSQLIELQQKVAERLNLEAGTFYVKYKDEDGDFILIACDGDLRDYMCVSRLEGKTCIVVLLEPKLPITDHL
ncbi:hypothetical protein ACSBR2_029141 [Camellia fascicularis]